MLPNSAASATSRVVRGNQLQVETGCKDIRAGISTARNVTVAIAHAVSTPSASEITSTCAPPIVLPARTAFARAISVSPLAGARKLT